MRQGAGRWTQRFIGREIELALLQKRLDRAASTGASNALSVRGRRQVGTSRLVQEFCDRSGAPYLYFTALKGATPEASMAGLHAELAASGIAKDPAALTERPPTSWADTFRAVAAALPDAPCLIVIDEVPWLAEQDPVFEASLQAAWDRLLSARPVVLLLLGSDLHMMERITSYDRPFYGRSEPLRLGPLTLADTAEALALAASDAIDAHLVSGGLPGVLRAWPRGMTALEYLRAECADPSSPVFTVPETALLSEFPTPALAGRVLRAVGGGERTSANIAAAVGGEGGLASGSLSPLLKTLTLDKQVLVADEPLSTSAGRPRLYRVADTNLRLYLGLLAQAHDLSRRGRVDAAFGVIDRQWTTWRGRAVEPLVRESIELACATGALPWAAVTTVGGWWNRAFDPEIDLIGADRGPIAREVLMVGSVKWLGTPVDGHDLAALRRGMTAVPGVDPGTTGTLVVSRSGRSEALSADAADAWWGPEDVLAAWQG